MADRDDRDKAAEPESLEKSVADTLASARNTLDQIGVLNKKWEVWSLAFCHGHVTLTYPALLSALPNVTGATAKVHRNLSSVPADRLWSGADLHSHRR